METTVSKLWGTLNPKMETQRERESNNLKSSSNPKLISLSLAVLLIAVFGYLAFAYPSPVTFNSPTPANASYASRNWTELNLTISNMTALSTFIANWNNTNYTIYDPSLVLDMNFNYNTQIGESNTTVVDNSMYGNNGTLTNMNTGINNDSSGWTSSGKFGNGLNFDGVNDYVAVGGPASLNFNGSSFSTSAWFKIGVLTSAWKTIASRGDSGTNGYGIEISSGNYYTCSVDGSNSGGANWHLSSGTPTLNVWHNIVCVYSWNDNLYMYVDGVLLANSTAYMKNVSAGGISNTNTFNIGSHAASLWYFNGTIDEVRIYNRSLSASEIAFQYQSEFQKYNATDWRYYNNVSSLVDSPYTYYGFANDTSGNSNTSATQKVTVDTVAPTITIDTPSNGASFNKPPYINGTATDINLAYIKTNSTYYTALYSTSPFNFTNTSAIPDGTYTINVSANDSAGNVGWATQTFRFDTVQPFVQIILPQNTTYNSVARTLNYTATDVNLNTVWYQYNGANTTLSGNTTFTALNNQQSTLLLYANDTAGNINSTSITFTIDTTPPAGISSLQNASQAATWIYWNWTNPADADFDHAEIWLNGTFKQNTSGNYYNATLLASNTWYQIQIRTADSHGNINMTFINSTTKTTGGTDTTPPSINSYSITPKAAINGTNVSLQMDASDNYAVQSIWAQITLPNSSQAIIMLPANYTTSISGRYNITFYANDTSGNTANITDYFIAQPASAFNITVFGYNNSAINTNLTVYYGGSAINATSSAGNYSLNLPDYIYDLEFTSFNGSLVVLLRNVNISYNQGRAVSFDNPPVSGYLAAYAVNNTLNISSAQVTLNYSGIGYSNEDYLGMYKCDGWNISARSCSGAWNSLSLVQNKTAKTLSANVTSFSGFAIKQEVVPAPPSYSGGNGYYHSLEITGIKAEPVLAGQSGKASITVQNTGGYDEEAVRISLVCPGGWQCGSVTVNISRGSIVTAALNIAAPKNAAPKSYSLSAKAENDYALQQGVFSFVIKPECASDADCKKDETCLNKFCVKLFDVKILRADSPIQPGDSFDFTYLMKGMADVKGDVVVQFWLEQGGKKITSGSDTIYVGSFEEKTETTSIFIPSDVPLGTYDFYVSVNYGKYTANAHRIVEVARNVPLILDLLLSKPLAVSNDTVKFSATLSLNKDGATSVKLDEKISGMDKIVWQKERNLMVNKSATVDEIVSGLKAGDYRLELTAYYENRSAKLVESFSAGAQKEGESPRLRMYAAAALIMFGILAFACFSWLRKKGRKRLCV
ncbi:Concanavalin A-like lectin/glucanases superfamily protein [uncultured archaeon]|nr:Concanavalin A-like lectin/glucanases superfamily protein [uncultured archaeon]